MSQLGNLSPEGSVAIGVLVCLLSSGIQSVGLTLQRKSHMLEDENYGEDTRRPPYRRRRWQLGFSMFLVANLVGSTIQLTTLPLPVLAALQAGGLVFNSICATLILGEAFTRYSLGGTVLVSAGAVLIAYFGALPEPAHSLSQLLDLFARQQFILWAIGQVLLTCAILGGLYLLKVIPSSKGSNSRLRLARGMCYGALSGILSAHSLLLAKSAVELLVRTIVDGENQFSNWQAWIILLGLVSIGLSQLYCLHSGLQLCSTSILYPFIFCVYNVITILDGLIYFNQSSRLSNLDTGLIILGTLILLSGVLCLSYRLADESSAGQLPPEITENPLTPPVGFIGSPLGHPTEQDPLIPKFRRSSINRLAAYQTDEESTVGTTQQVRRTSHPLPASHGDDDVAPERLKFDKVRKRATFADYGTGEPAGGGNVTRARRASTNVLRSSPAAYNQRARRKTLQDSSALWGELEETGPAPKPAPAFVQSPPGRRRRRSSEASSGGAVKHGDLGHVSPLPSLGAAIEERREEEEEDGDDDGGQMSASTPLLLHRIDTGRTYRDLRPRQRRSSEPGLAMMRRSNRRASNPLHPLDFGLDHSWHTIDSSTGRPVDGGTGAGHVERVTGVTGPSASAATTTGERRQSQPSGRRAGSALWSWLRGSKGRARGEGGGGGGGGGEEDEEGQRQ